MVDNEMAGGRSSVLTIEEILNDKKLFYKYILGAPCNFCKALRFKEIKDTKDIHQLQEEAIKKPATNNVRDQRIALLKAKMKKLTENPQIDLVEEVEKDNPFKCLLENCFNDDYIDIEKVETKYNEIIDGLKRVIDVWRKKGYNIYGYKDKNYGIKFVKDSIEIKYSNKEEQVEKNWAIGATEICLLSEWIMLTNDLVKTHVEVVYGLKKS